VTTFPTTFDPVDSRSLPNFRAGRLQAKQEFQVLLCVGPKGAEVPLTKQIRERRLAT
jgi:RIO-like serine/threonine protein kinase